MSAPLLSVHVLTVLIRWTRSGGLDQVEPMQVIAGAPAARCDTLMLAPSALLTIRPVHTLFIHCSYSVLYPICALPALLTTCIRSVHTPFTIRSAHSPLCSLAHHTLHSLSAPLTYYPLFSLPDLCTIRSAHYMIESALPANHSISRTSVFR